jgi:hypothetical protein
MYGDTFTMGGECDLGHKPHYHTNIHTNPYLLGLVFHVIVDRRFVGYNRVMSRVAFFLLNLLLSLLLFSLGWRYAEKEREALQSRGAMPYSQEHGPAHPPYSRSGI